MESTLLTLVFISWGVITGVLVVLLSYRATLLREDNQIFVDPAVLDQYQRQQSLAARRSLLMGEIIVLSVISGVLLITCVGFSIYRGLSKF